MNYNVYAFAALLTAIGALAADFGTVAADASALKTALEETSAQIDAWDGTLAGALSIQNSEEKIQSALDTVNSDAKGLKIEESRASEGVGLVKDLQSPITDVLGKLNGKLSELQGVGAASIVQGDIAKLAPTAYELEQSIYDAAPCSTIGDIKTAFDAINQAFSEAITNFEVQGAGEPPTAPESCDSSSGDDSAAASAGTSAAPATAGASAPASGAAGTAAGTASGAQSQAPAATAAAQPVAGDASCPAGCGTVTVTVTECGAGGPPAPGPSQPPAGNPSKPAENPSQPPAATPSKPAENPSKPAENPSQPPAATPSKPAENPSQPPAATPSKPAQNPSQPAQAPSTPVQIEENSAAAVQIGAGAIAAVGIALLL